MVPNTVILPYRAGVPPYGAGPDTLFHRYRAGKINVDRIEQNPYGQLYSINVNGKDVRILLTFHCLKRMKKWKINLDSLLDTLLFP